MIDLHGPFRQRSEKGGVIHLLKGLAAHHIGADLADEQDHRNRILHGGVNADSGIGRPRATGNETQAGLARQLAPGRRHIGSPALLPAEHEIKGVGVVDHRVENGKIGFAGHPEATCRAKRDKAVHEKLAAVSGPAIRHLTCLRFIG